MNEHGQVAAAVVGAALFGAMLGMAITMISTRPQWDVAKWHCRALGHSTGWWDEKAMRIRCVNIIQVRDGE